ncbi:sugar kinase [Trebonia kvetii]|uniref:Sugar kinase n=1 Tax=Trebonia kvetii TaxID=2480626 RepID=A0A6P2BWM7_9ACTN|nr:PfkB family carbohydrate kinase [Trebonia kvetii]TVZ02555.1 sugar kinase [Trebonia kvetii]
MTIPNGGVPRPSPPPRRLAFPDGGVPRPSRPRRLVFAGEAIVDVVLRVPALPPRGGDMLATSSEVTAGGGFNVMSAAARHGLLVLYAGGHGTGPWGDVIRSALAAEGIAVLRPADAGRDTGFDVALVEPDAERTFVTHLGAETVRGPGGWDGVPAGPGDAVYVSGYGLVAPDSGSVLGAWAAALPFGVLLFFDPGPLAAQIPAAVLGPVLARCDWLSCNEREATVLAGTVRALNPGQAADPGEATDPGQAVDSGEALHPGEAFDPGEMVRRLLGVAGARADDGAGGVLVRVGARGCYVGSRASGAVERVPAPVVTAVDTTGAGDAHAGVFLAALADGLSPVDAAARANAAAAYAVTRHGPATAPTRAELDAWWRG